MQTNNDIFFLPQHYKKIVFSHHTALFLYGVISNLTIDITIYNNYHNNLSNHNIYYINKKYLNLGKTTIKYHNVLIPTYNLERTVIDLIRSRKRLKDLDIFYIIDKISNKIDISKVYKYAQIMHIPTKKVKIYLPWFNA